MKLPDPLLKTKDPELSDWIDRANLLINSGKYEFPIYDGEPSAGQANEGESLVTNYTDTSGNIVRNLEVYISGVWCTIAFDSTGSVSAGGFTDRIIDADNNTGIFTQFNNVNENILRHYSNGVYVVAIDTYGIQVASEYKISFNGSLGNTYWTYSTASSYMQCFVNGSVRMEM